MFFNILHREEWFFHANRRLTIEVPREVPVGRAVLTFTPASVQKPIQIFQHLKMNWKS